MSSDRLTSSVKETVHAGHRQSALLGVPVVDLVCPRPDDSRNVLAGDKEESDNDGGVVVWPDGEDGRSDDSGTQQRTDDPPESIAGQVGAIAPSKVGDHRDEICAGGNNVAVSRRVTGRLEVDAHVAVGLAGVPVLVTSALLCTCNLKIHSQRCTWGTRPTTSSFQTCV